MPSISRKKHYSLIQWNNNSRHQICCRTKECFRVGRVILFSGVKLQRLREQIYVYCVLATIACLSCICHLVDEFRRVVGHCVYSEAKCLIVCIVILCQETSPLWCGALWPQTFKIVSEWLGRPEGWCEGHKRHHCLQLIWASFRIPL